MPGDPLESIYKIIHPEDLPWVAHDRRDVPGGMTNNEYRLIRADGSERWVHARAFPIANPSGAAPWIVEIIEDITQRREAQRHLVHLARHDALTNLPNSTFMRVSLEEAIVHAEENKLGVSVLLLDIDHFKNVNDTLGHTIGDALLRNFAGRLKKCTRPGDIIGRLGGDEFVIIIQTPIDSGGALAVANRIKKSLLKPLMFEEQNILVTASIGIASYPNDACDPETLIRYADAAMYEAKAAGRDRYHFYTAEMNLLAREKQEMDSALRVALGRDEFVLHFQPKMHIDSGKLAGVEALIRWKRPGHGLIAPGCFIPHLEEMGLIVPVGGWVIDKACQQIREWEQAGLGRIRIAVNVSSRQIREEQFFLQVVDALGRYQIDPALLEFEITESTLMAPGEYANTALRKLKDLGISISIDDFGTGYSNLAYLKRFLVDALKIDITFIRDITTDADDAAIVCAIINMAHSLRLKVITEGVETPEQFEFLRAHGCDEAQGFLLSKPVPADELFLQLRQAAAKKKLPQIVPVRKQKEQLHA